MNLTNLSDGALSLLRAMGKGEIFAWDREIGVYVYLEQSLNFDVARELIDLKLVEAAEPIEQRIITYVISKKGRELL